MSPDMSHRDLIRHTVVHLFSSNDIRESGRQLAESAARLQGGWAAILLSPSEDHTIIHSSGHDHASSAVLGVYLNAKMHVSSRSQLSEYLADLGVLVDNLEPSQFRLEADVLRVNPLLTENGGVFGYLISIVNSKIYDALLEDSLRQVVAAANLAMWRQLKFHTKSPGNSFQMGSNTEIAEALFHRANGSLASLSLLAELGDFSLPESRSRLGSVVRSIGDDLALLDEVTLSWSSVDGTGMLSSVAAVLPLLLNDLHRTKGIRVAVSKSAADAGIRLWVPASAVIRLLESIVRYSAQLVANTEPSTDAATVQVDVLSASRLELEIAISLVLTKKDPLLSLIEPSRKPIRDVIEHSLRAFGGQITWDSSYLRTTLTLKRDL